MGVSLLYFRSSLLADGRHQIYVKGIFFLIEYSEKHNNTKGGFFPAEGYSTRYLVSHGLIISCVIFHGYVAHIVYLLLMIYA